MRESIVCFVCRSVSDLRILLDWPEYVHCVGCAVQMPRVTGKFSSNQKSRMLKRRQKKEIENQFSELERQKCITIYLKLWKVLNAYKCLCSSIRTRHTRHTPAYLLDCALQLFGSQANVCVCLCVIVWRRECEAHLSHNNSTTTHTCAIRFGWMSVCRCALKKKKNE